MKALKQLTLQILALVMLVAGGFVTEAAVPDGMNFQAYLTNADGTPVDTDIAITFAAYNVNLGGVPLWSQSQTMTVDQGLLSINLGNPVNPFPAGLFDGPVYIGMFVAGEELLPRREVKTSGYAYKAADADTLTGFDAASLDQSAEVSTLQSGIATVASDLTAAQSGISSLASDVAINDGRISTLEATGGDITSVSAGPGLVGGAAAGNATLSVAAGGITNSMLAADSVGPTQLASSAVTSFKIAEGAVGPTKLNAAGNYNLAGLTVGGFGFNIDSGADIIIRDDYNGLRWYSSDGFNQFAAFLSRSSDNMFYDYNQGVPMLYSNVNGIGIGTSSPASTHAVTIPSLKVNGSTDVGYERVSATIDVTSSATCHSAGNLTCYYGIASVSCPVGKKVVGGGTNGVTGRYGSVSSSYPVGDSSWSCGLSYDISATRTCYAICARFD